MNTDKHESCDHVITTLAAIEAKVDHVITTLAAIEAKDDTKDTDDAPTQ